MDGDFSRLNGIYKPGYILIILALGLRETRVFPDAFQRVLPVDLDCDPGNGGDLSYSCK